MTTVSRAVRSPILPVVLLLTAAWSTVPYAHQDNANDGFIFFTSDRDYPSNLGVCNNCEDIYVMSPDGTNPVRLTNGGGVEAIRPPTAAAVPTGPTARSWSRFRAIG